MKRKTFRRLTATLLATLMVVTVTTAGFPLTASAEDAVTYTEYSWNDQTKTLSTTTKTITDYTIVTGEMFKTYKDGLMSGNYVVIGNVTVNDYFYIRKNQTVNPDNYYEYINTQPIGKEKCCSSAGIGAGDGGNMEGTVIIKGGNVNVWSGLYAAGIGGGMERGGFGGKGGVVYIGGGTIKIYTYTHPLGVSNQAIGKGDSNTGKIGSVYIDDSSNITGKNMRVIAHHFENKDEPEWTKTAAEGERSKLCQKNANVEICECPHTDHEGNSGLTYTIVDGNKHIEKCKFCGYVANVSHTGETCPCGYQKTTYTVTLNLMAGPAHSDYRSRRRLWAKAVPLVEKMLQYGAYAKEYFDETDTLNDLENVSIDINDPVIGTFPEGTTFEGATLSLKSETTLSLYFTSNTTLTFSCADYNVETVTSGGYQIARIRGIMAKQIDSIITLTVNGVKVEYSPLNYCKNVLAEPAPTSDEEQAEHRRLVNAVKALYAYWLAADDYFD